MSLIESPDPFQILHENNSSSNLGDANSDDNKSKQSDEPEHPDIDDRDDGEVIDNLSDKDYQEEDAELKNIGQGLSSITPSELLKLKQIMGAKFCNFDLKN